MIALPTGTRVWLAAGVTDMRTGMNGLAPLVQTTLETNPFCGHLFVFRGCAPALNRLFKIAHIRPLTLCRDVFEC